MILMLTPNSLNPLHPRVETNKKILEKDGYKVYLYNLNSESIINKINYMTLGFFNILAFFRSFIYLLKHNKNIKILYVTDLQYLPIAILGKFFKKKVIYETLDNNVELHFYNLSKKIPFIKKFKFIKRVFVGLEKFLSKFFVDRIIVNSKALEEYFYPLFSYVLYYTSPFENLENFKKGNAIGVYLGLFSEDKGGNEILDFIEKYNLQCFIFGNIKENSLKKRIYKFVKNNKIVYYKRIPSYELRKYLINLLKNYRVIGFSLIKEVHFSYKTQEANKDIDYLAMGVPIIGNHRKPTEEKILNGCGVFIEDKEKIKSLIQDPSYYSYISNNAKIYYNNNYSQNLYKHKLLQIVKDLLK